MRALGVVWLVGLLGCGKAWGPAAEREREWAEAERRGEHPPRPEPYHPPREAPHPPRQEPVAEVPEVRHPELADPLAVGPKPVFTSAEEGYRAGQRAYDLGNYDDAIRAFSAAYELMSHPSFLYNIAQAHRLRGDLRSAIFFYRAYLKLDPESKQRDAILRRVQELEDELAGRTEVEPPVG